MQRPGIAPTQLLQPDNVRLSELPLYCPQAYVQHQQVSKGLYADFSALQTQPYKVGYIGSCQDKYASHLLPFGLASPSSCMIWQYILRLPLHACQH